MPEPINVAGVDRESTSDLKEEWLVRLGELVRCVARWAEQSGWRTREISRTMTDSILGEYRAPALLLQKETVEVILNPVSRVVPGADGAVDLYLMPGYDDIASFTFDDGEWRLYYAFGNDSATAPSHDPEPLPLSEEAVVRVLDELVAHAA